MRAASKKSLNAFKISCWSPSFDYFMSICLLVSCGKSIMTSLDKRIMFDEQMCGRVSTNEQNSINHFNQRKNRLVLFPIVRNDDDNEISPCRHLAPCRRFADSFTTIKRPLMLHLLYRHVPIRHKVELGRSIWWNALCS